MSRGTLKVNYEAMDGLAAQLLNTAVAVESDLTDMERKLESHMSEWSGDDKIAYQQAKAGWDGAMKQMLADLSDLAKTVGLSKDEYLAAEGQNAKRFTW